MSEIENTPVEIEQPTVEKVETVEATPEEKVAENVPETVTDDEIVNSVPTEVTENNTTEETVNNTTEEAVNNTTEETVNNTTEDTPAEVVESSQTIENPVKEETTEQPIVNEETVEKLDTSVPTYTEPLPEIPEPSSSYYDIETITQEANKDLLLKNNEESNSQPLDDEDNTDYTSLSKEELIEKVLFYKEQCRIIKQESDKKIKNTNDYIERLEKATEQRIERLRKQNQDDIDEIKKYSDLMIKNEKERASTYVQNMKKNVDDEREILRQIENDSRSRFQKEKEEKNEALVEINRLKSIINSLHNDVEDRENKIQNLEENNLNVFVQKDKELEQAINQIETERNHSREINEENLILKEKIIELSDELKQFRNESEIRNSQINLINEDNKELHKKVSSLSRKNEELTSLYEIKMDESANLKNEIERLNKTIDNVKRNKRMSRLAGMTPLSSFQDPNSSRCFSEYSTISGFSSSNKILDGLDRKASTALTNDQLSDVSLNYDQSTVSKEEVKPEEDATAAAAAATASATSDAIVNNDGIVTMNDLTPGVTKVETVEGSQQEGLEVSRNLATVIEEKPEPRTLVIDTNMTINNNGGDPAFNYQDDLALEGDDLDDLGEDEEDTIMGAMVKPLVFHTNDQTFINFSENMKESYDHIYNTKLVKQCESEEIVQCLDLSGSYMGFFSKRKLLSGLKNNTVVIQKADPESLKARMQQDMEPECSLCTLKYHNQDGTMLWYQFYFEDEKNSPHELICMFCRERLVTICNWYKYLSMIAKRIVKHDIETIYINCLQLKENMYHARNGLTTDDNDDSLLNVVATNPRPDIIRPPTQDFTDIDIEGINLEEEIVKKSSFDSHQSNSMDSETMKNNSELVDNATTPTTPKSNVRSSLCFNNTIQKKLALSLSNIN